MPDLQMRAPYLTLHAPSAVGEGGELMAAVAADVSAGSVVHGEVSLLRTVVLRRRRPRAGGGTHVAPSRQAETVVTERLPEAVSTSGRYAAEVRLVVPAEGPPSAEGGLVTVDWALRARLRASTGEASQAVAKLRVLTRAPGFDAVTLRPARSDAAGHTVVTLQDLSTRRIGGGTLLSGEVGLLPLTAGLIRTVRVELVVRERVGAAAPAPGTAGRAAALATLAAPAATALERETVVASMVPAAAIVAEPRRGAFLPFAIRVPTRILAPSLAAPDIEVSWLLRAVACRSLQRDAHTEVDLQAVTL